MSLLKRASKFVFATADLVVPNPEGPRLLIYHQVGAGTGREMEVTVADFQFQLEWLLSECEVVDLESALDRWSEADSDRLVVLTFDDGYADTFSVAFPLMEEKGIPFTVYLATNQLETGPATLRDPAAPLSWDQVNTMVSSGLCTVGAHTHSHQDLRSVTLEQVEEELGTSDRIIQERTGIVPRHFAYPWGYWSKTADGPVRARYQSAVLGGSPTSNRPLDRHLIPRFPVQLSDGQHFFPTRLRSGLLVEERVRRAIRGYRGP